MRFKKYFKLFLTSLGVSYSFYLIKNELNNNKLNKTLNKEKLLSVILVTRHGARTPLHLIHGLNEV